MDLEHRVEMLEQELQILKSQIQATLLEIQEQVLTSTYSVLRSDELTRSGQGSSNSAPVMSDRNQAQNTDKDDAEEPPMPMVRRVNLEEAKPPRQYPPEASQQYTTYGNEPAPSHAPRQTWEPVQVQDRYEDDYDVPPPAPVRHVKPTSRRPDPEIEDRPPQTRRVRQSLPLDDDESEMMPTRSKRSQPVNAAKRPDSRRKAVAPAYEDDQHEDAFDPLPRRSPKRQRDLEETQPDRPDLYEEPDLSFAPTVEIPDWTALNRLAEWVGGKVKQVGKRRARELIEANAERGYYNEQIKSVLLQLVALYEGDGSVITRRIDAVLESLAEPFAKETDKFAPNDYTHNVDQNLVMRLITGLQNVGTSERRKRG